MMKELRRTSVVVLVMIASLFVSTSIIQVVSAEELRDHPRNSRTFYANLSVNRGPILVEGTPVAYSVPIDGPIAYQRVYDNGALYAPVTGYLTIGQGNTGLEAEMNSYLTGSTGGQFFDQVSAVLTGQKPQGAAVETTILASVQQAAWDALGDYEGAVIALDPQTNKILAMVSKPTFDPNTLAVHDTTAVINQYNALLDDPMDPLINRTMNGDLDPPGSVFKLVTAAAALEAGYPPEYTLPNPAVLDLPQTDHVVYNHSRGRCGVGETVTIFDAVRLSCNIPMAELGQQLTYRTIRDQAVAFGFDESVGVPMASTPSVYPRVLDEPRTMLSAFGQGDVRASPLQMAMIASAIANGGTMMQPSLVEAVVSPDQTTLQRFEPEPIGQPISTGTARALTAMMVASVESGAASDAAIPGLAVAGKTGTAENGPDEPYSLWFVGFAPADNPRVAVAVVVQDGGALGQTGSGAAIAAPIGKAVIEAVMAR
ncbi:MAG TPA: penicillin-binding transpeptidase domain-containing protein [Microbacteriaceae bacterium]|nr:penicillin-binding transpeptidase domain-containing protein [Microbacteriaceae bacterium]